MKLFCIVLFCFALLSFNSGWSTAKEGASSGRFWPRPKKKRNRSFVTEHWYIPRTTSRYLREAHCKAFGSATMNAFFLLKHAWLFWFLAVVVKWTLLFECLPYHTHTPAHGIFEYLSLPKTSVSFLQENFVNIAQIGFAYQQWFLFWWTLLSSVTFIWWPMKYYYKCCSLLVPSFVPKIQIKDLLRKEERSHVEIPTDFLLKSSKTGEGK